MGQRLKGEKRGKKLNNDFKRSSCSRTGRQCRIDLKIVKKTEAGGGGYVFWGAIELPVGLPTCQIKQE